MDAHSGKPDFEEGSVEKDYDALEEVLRKLPKDRQDAFQESIDEQKQAETEDAGGTDSPSDD